MPTNSRSDSTPQGDGGSTASHHRAQEWREQVFAVGLIAISAAHLEHSVRNLYLEAMTLVHEPQGEAFLAKTREKISREQGGRATSWVITRLKGLIDRAYAGSRDRDHLGLWLDDVLTTLRHRNAALHGVWAEVNDSGDSLSTGSLYGAGIAVRKWTLLELFELSESLSILDRAGGILSLRVRGLELRDATVTGIVDKYMERFHRNVPQA
jgi:hypothetical protein